MTLKSTTHKREGDRQTARERERERERETFFVLIILILIYSIYLSRDYNLIDNISEFID